MKKDSNQKNITSEQEQASLDNLPKKSPFNSKYIIAGLIVIIIILTLKSFLPSRGISQVLSSNNVLNQNNNIVDPRSQVGLEYYLEKSGDNLESGDIEAVVEDFGCHSEIHIYKAGEIVMRLSYFNGEVYEL